MDGDLKSLNQFFGLAISFSDDHTDDRIQSKVLEITRVDLTTISGLLDQFLFCLSSFSISIALLPRILPQCLLRLDPSVDEDEKSSLEFALRKEWVILEQIVHDSVYVDHFRYGRTSTDFTFCLDIGRDSFINLKRDGTD